MTKFALVLLASGAVNAVYGTVLISSVIGIILPALKNKRVYLNALTSSALWVLALYGITYVYIGMVSLQGILYYLITPLIAFIAGWAIIDNCRGNGADTLLQYIMCIIIGYGTHALLNYSINQGNERWVLIDFYSGLLRAATGSGCINTMILSLITYILWIEKSKVYRLVEIGVLIISLLYAVLLGTRTQFAIMIIVNVITMLLLFYERNRLGGFIRFVVTITMTGLIILLLYENDVAGVRSYLEESNLMVRFASYNERAQREADANRINGIVRGLINLMEYPFGVHADTNYNHNMWLDIGRVSGIIPFALMIVYSVVTFCHAAKLFFDKRQKERFRYVLLSVYLGTMLNLATEPVMEGLRDFFYNFCLINGMVECYYKKWRRNHAYRSN